jgi:hypothetical protein
MVGVEVFQQVTNIKALHIGEAKVTKIHDPDERKRGGGGGVQIF